MKPLLRHQLNPCDVDRFRGLAAVGDALAFLFERFTAGTECICCLGMRLVALAVGSFALGAALL